MLLLAYFVAVNVVAFAAFLVDKRVARRGSQRLAEGPLLLLALLGGSLGAFLGMAVAQHWTHKRGFRLQFQSVIALQIAALGFLAFHGV